MKAVRVDAFGGPEQLVLDGFTFPQGAAIGIPYTTAYRAVVQTSRVSSGEWVLVHGASGAVGLAAVQIARAAGGLVIGTGSTPGWSAADSRRRGGCGS